MDKVNFQVLFIGLTYIGLGASIATVELWRIRAREPFNALSLFNGAYFLFFVFVPLNILWLGELAVRQKYAFETWSYGNIWTALVLLASYIIFALGFLRITSNTRLSFDGCDSLRIITWLTRLYFALGALSLIYHVDLAGGVVDALVRAPYIRMGQYPLESDWLFIRQFNFFLATAFMLGWALWIDKNNSGKPVSFWQKAFLVLLALVFVYYALSTYGRREFLYPVFICLMVWMFAGSRRMWEGLGYLFLLILVWFLIHSIAIPAAVHGGVQQSIQSGNSLPVLANSFMLNLMLDVYIKTLQGLGDTFMHFVAAENASLWQFGFLTDLQEIPSRLLPSKLLGFERPRGMLGETSAFILGKPLEDGFNGEEPLGLHGYLLVNFSYFGMLPAFYLFGIGYRKLDIMFRPEKGASAVSWLLFFWLVLGALEFFREGMLVFILIPRFSWWLTIGVLLWFMFQKSRSLARK